MDEDIFEKLAELEHEQWCDWASVISREISSLLDIIDKSDADLTEDDKQAIFNSRDRLTRWEKLMIPYSDLPEDEKDKDRVYVKKIFSIFQEK